MTAKAVFTVTCCNWLWIQYWYGYFCLESRNTYGI